MKQTTENIFVVGPTGSGKSKISLALAKALKGVVINADSCQIYHGLPVLTAQPSEEEKLSVPHYLYNFHPLTEPYNVASYLQNVEAILKKLPQNCPRVFVGGTGLYIKALIEGLNNQAIDPVLRKKTRELYQKKGITPLYETLKKNDKTFSIQPNDHQRILRAYELYLAGKKATTVNTPSSPICTSSFIVHINPGPGNLREKIKHRLENMLSSGALEEVKNVQELQKNLGPTVSKIIGLKELLVFLSEETSLEKAKEKMYHRTCQYAKRQRTWFRHQLSSTVEIPEIIETEAVASNWLQKIIEKLESKPQ